jgi:hypothetical protein
MMVSIERPPQWAASFIFLASGITGPYLNSEPSAGKVPVRNPVVRLAGNPAKIRHMIEWFVLAGRHP